MSLPPQRGDHEGPLRPERVLSADEYRSSAAGPAALARSPALTSPSALLLVSFVPGPDPKGAAPPGHPRPVAQGPQSRQSLAAAPRALPGRSPCGVRTHFPGRASHGAPGAGSTDLARGGARALGHRVVSHAHQQCQPCEKTTPACAARARTWATPPALVHRREGCALPSVRTLSDFLCL